MRRSGPRPSTASAVGSFHLTVSQLAADSWTGESLRDLATRKNITLGAFSLTTLIPPVALYKVVSPPYLFNHPLTPFERLNADNFNLICTGIGWPDARPSNVADYASTRDHFDSDTQFASQNGQRFRCGGAVYGLPVYLPDWLKQGGYTRSELIEILIDRTQAIAAFFGGVVQEWIVVNEAYHNRGGDFWQKGIGDDYVQIAFETMRAAAPKAMLIYNDYDNDFPGPTQDISLRLATDLQARGLIDGIGLQMHLTPNTPKQSRLAEAIARFRAMGLQTTITECDINMRGFPGTDADRLALQASTYRWAFETALDAGCRSIVLAGLTEGDSWLNIPSSAAFGGPEAMPGVWDPTFQPRPAYYAIRAALQAV